MSSSRVLLGSLFQSDGAAAVKALSVFFFVFEDGELTKVQIQTEDHTVTIWTYLETCIFSPYRPTYRARYFKNRLWIFSRVATKRSDQIYYFMLAKKGRVHNDSSNFYNDTVHKLENGDVVRLSESLHVELLINVSFWREYPDCIELFAVLYKANYQKKKPE